MKVRILRVYDWSGLYVDNNLVEEGHSIRNSDIFKLIFPDIDFKEVWFDSVDPNLNKWDNRCPQKWQDEFTEIENV